ncbi:MAG: Crp/Fnr family transcriptional regulator [Gammaproteobacteria bacterium]|nr:Crp/Fnr family transcriptional regulator [Gammaproteobacteria bacterium]MDH5728146.1 Crp/Fnr family transcriptional regulator [Gammaproteobacteria bacterium]
MHFLKQNFTQNIVEQSFLAGEIIFHAGERIHRVFEIKAGQVKMVRYLTDGTEPIIHFVNQGEILAEASLFTQCYHCTAIATQDTSLNALSISVVLAELENNPRFSLGYIQLLSKQIQQQRMLTEIRSIRSAEQRLMSYFRLQADDQGLWCMDSSLKILASRLGLTHETLYRVLAKLEKQEKITRSKHHIQIHHKLGSENSFL